MTTATLWTVDDVAARLGMNRQWVYAETRAGRIPVVRLGRSYRYRPEAIEAWIEELEDSHKKPGGR